MSFADAVRTALVERFADFNGRSRRSEYWWFFLFNVLVNIVLQIIAAATDLRFITIILVALLVPGIAVGVRRLHDIDKSGWLILLGLIPLVGAIILIVWACQDSTPDNRYGPNPKGASYGQQPGYGV